MQYRVTAVIDAVNLAPLIEALVPLSGKPLQVSACTGEKPERAITRTPPASLDDLLGPAPAHANYDPPPAPAPRPPAPPARRKRFANPSGTVEELITSLLTTGQATTRELRESVTSAGYSRSAYENKIWEMLKYGKVELVPDAPERTVRLKG